MVTMTCCNSRYATVTETIEHTCMTDLDAAIATVRERYEAAKYQSDNLSDKSSERNARERLALTASLKVELYALLDRKLALV